MPTLEAKYAELIAAANASGATGLAVRAQDNILYIDGEVPTGAVKGSALECLRQNRS